MRRHLQECRSGSRTAPVGLQKALGEEVHVTVRRLDPQRFTRMVNARAGRPIGEVRADIASESLRIG
jgi:hypothetical protein